ncbi:nucleotide exchange factor GrpE [Rhodococcus sp. NPDC058521]|uniref:nucleotide exchange factor GrpE n=1 Tax=Rhodococcus sp. NPDC058521 TaxID=3346536 RepID=UPI00364C75AD
MTSENSEQEPVTFVDKRKIDPDTGEVREVAGEAQPLSGSEVAGDVQDGAAPEVEEPAAEAAAPETGELAERTADLQRLQAEYANYRRRVQRDKQSDIAGAKASVVSELLGVLDDLDRARAHGDLDSGPLKGVADKLTGTLTSLGLSEFGAEGDPFDPELHEAVQHEGEGNDPVLGTVMRKGYRFGDRVLRHAMVAVTDRAEGATPADTDPASAAESDQQ